MTPTRTSCTITIKGTNHSKLPYILASNLIPKKMAAISWSRGPCLKFIASSWIRSPRKPLSCFHGGSKDRFGWCDLSDFFSWGKLLDIDYWIVCRFIIYVDEWFFIFYQPLMLFLQNQNKKSPPLQFRPGITQIQQTSATWYLGCSFNPFEKYDRQNWIISLWNHHLVVWFVCIILHTSLEIHMLFVPPRSTTQGRKNPKTFGRFGNPNLNLQVETLGAWMSQEVSKCLVNGLFHLLINGVYWGYNPLTNHLLNSWYIQVGGVVDQ